MIKVITDSVAGIRSDEAKERDIEVVSLYVRHQGVEYVDAEMDVDDFYSRIDQMVDDIPTSSQPSQLVFEEAFERAARENDEVLGVFISSRMSGTYEGAIRAARSVKERNESFKCTLIDSTTNSFDEASCVLDAVDARDAGLDLAACARETVEGVMRSRFLFTPETLTFLKAGGRIGSAAALVGNLIQLCPVLTVRDGEASTFAKVRTRKKALDKIVKTFKEDVEAHGLKRIVVHYIGDKAPAVTWAREVIEPLVGHAVQVLPVSPVIGTHVGPAVGIAYECKERIEGKFAGNPDDLVFSV